MLDAALLRPGRFDRRVPVERPDRLGREQILRVSIYLTSLQQAVCWLLQCELCETRLIDRWG